MKQRNSAAWTAVGRCRCVWMANSIQFRYPALWPSFVEPGIHSDHSVSFSKSENQSVVHQQHTSGWSVPISPSQSTVFVGQWVEWDALPPANVKHEKPTVCCNGFHRHDIDTEHGLHSMTNRVLLQQVGWDPLQLHGHQSGHGKTLLHNHLEGRHVWSQHVTTPGLSWILESNAD